MKNNRMYVYPLSARFDEKLNNPYIKDVISSIENYFICVNKKNRSTIGFFNVTGYFLKTKYFHLNWIEDLPDKKGGMMQSVFLLLIIPIIRFTGKKIIWTAHNKVSHYQKNLRMKKKLMSVLARKSHYIITHSQEGVEYVKQLNKEKNTAQLMYIPHPVKNNIYENSIEFTYDIIIWGNIVHYKGIHQFLQYLKERGLEKKYKILIAGRIVEPAYEQVLKEYLSENITFINRFIQKNELEKLIKASRIVLFTYQQEYVLSSGALMDSIGYGRNVIGPDIGAFRDLREEGLVITYTDFNDLIKKIDECLGSSGKINNERLLDFISKNSWENYGLQLYSWLNNNTNSLIINEIRRYHTCKE
jgi:glycosyltransferase involved in cell wall biosynthesis